MFYSKVIAIPAQTYPEAPIKGTLTIAEGTIRRLWIRWRYGIGNLGGARLQYASFVYWPLSLGEWFPSSDFPIEFEENFLVETEPHELEVLAYNEDDVYPHELFVACLVLREKPLRGIEELNAYLEAGVA